MYYLEKLLAITHNPSITSMSAKLRQSNLVNTKSGI